MRNKYEAKILSAIVSHLSAKGVTLQFILVSFLTRLIFIILKLCSCVRSSYTRVPTSSLFHENILSFLILRTRTFPQKALLWLRRDLTCNNLHVKIAYPRSSKIFLLSRKGASSRGHHKDISELPYVTLSCESTCAFLSKYVRERMRKYMKI